MLPPELDETPIEGWPGFSTEFMCFTVGPPYDDVAIDSDERRGPALKACRVPFLAISIRNRAHAGNGPAADDVQAILRGPNHRVGRANGVPHRRTRLLKWLHFHGVVLETPELACRRDGLLSKAATNCFERLGVHLGGFCRFEAECIKLVWRGAATDPKLEAATAQVIESADFFVQTGGVVGRQQI